MQPGNKYTRVKVTKPQVCQGRAKSSIPSFFTPSEPLFFVPFQLPNKVEGMRHESMMPLTFKTSALLILKDFPGKPQNHREGTYQMDCSSSIIFSHPYGIHITILPFTSSQNPGAVGIAVPLECNQTIITPRTGFKTRVEPRVRSKPVFAFLDPFFWPLLFLRHRPNTSSTFTTLALPRRSRYEGPKSRRESKSDGLLDKFLWTDWSPTVSSQGSNDRDGAANQGIEKVGTLLLKGSHSISGSRSISSF